ncbi:hypothetical protein [Fusobacterium sp.]|uniref:hypothetical protein n=1 Tax=Fusobacterium sp. TaxID=68766 RepID=UPI002638B3F9|nr:hypothetical protein [Fusobacterium sp.]
MAKKSVTVYLPDDILNIIDNYKDEYKLKNRTIAVERIILEWNMYKSLTFTVSSDNVNTNVDALQQKDYRKSKQDIQREIINAGINEAFDELEF